MVVASNHFKKISRIKNMIVDDKSLIYEREKGYFMKIMSEKLKDIQEIKDLQQKLEPKKQINGNRKMR